MPSAYVQVTCDTNMQRFHEMLVKQRALVANSSKASETACKYIRLQINECAVTSLIAITRPVHKSSQLGGMDITGDGEGPSVAATVSAAAKGRKKGANVIAADDIAAMFASEEKTEAKYYFLVLQAAFIKSVQHVLNRMFTDIYDALAARPNAETASCVLEVCIVGKRTDDLEPRIIQALLAVHGQHKQQAVDEAIAAANQDGDDNDDDGVEVVIEPSSVPTAIDSFVVTCFDTEKEVSDRVLHTSLYFSQFKDMKVRAEVQQHAKRKVDDVNMNRLYTTCLCEIPNVSERRAQVIASTYRTFGQLMTAISKDDGSFENALSSTVEFGGSRQAGLGLAAAVRTALTTRYCPDDEDPYLANLRRHIHEGFGLIPKPSNSSISSRTAATSGGGVGVNTNGQAAAGADSSRRGVQITPTPNASGVPTPTPPSIVGSSRKSKRIISLSSSDDNSDDDDDDLTAYALAPQSRQQPPRQPSVTMPTVQLHYPRARSSRRREADDDYDEVRGSGPLFSSRSPTNTVVITPAAAAIGGPSAARTTQQQREDDDDDDFSSFGLDGMLGGASGSTSFGTLMGVSPLEGGGAGMLAGSGGSGGGREDDRRVGRKSARE